MVEEVSQENYSLHLQEILLPNLSVDRVIKDVKLKS